jgi:spore coat polysaccharide biosynthesis protein SpsF
MESTRLPGKVMMPLAGEPLLLRFIERIRRSKYGHALVVATTNRPSDHAIVELCLLHGIDVMRGHPTDLLDRHYQAAVQHGADVVVKIPSDSMHISPSAMLSTIPATCIRPHSRMGTTSR